MSQTYDKANRELDEIIARSKALDELNTKLLQYKEIYEQLVSDIKDIRNKILPDVKAIVDGIRDARMTINREALEISQSLGEVASNRKRAEDVVRVVGLIEMIAKGITPETVAVIHILANKNNEEKK